MDPTATLLGAAAAAATPPLAAQPAVKNRRRSKASRQRMKQVLQEAKQEDFLKKAEHTMHREAAKQVRRYKNKFRRMVLKVRWPTRVTT